MICRLEYYYFCYYLVPDPLLLGKQSIPSLFLFLLGDRVLFAKLPRLDLNLHCSPGWNYIPLPQLPEQLALWIPTPMPGLRCLCTYPIGNIISLEGFSSSYRH